MRKLLFVIFTFLIITISCTTQKQPVNTFGVNVTSVYTMSTDTFTIVQIDSMSHQDNIPLYEKWVKSYFKDGSTGVVYEYATLYDPESEVLYTVKKLNEKSYIVMKRQTNKK